MPGRSIVDRLATLLFATPGRTASSIAAAALVAYVLGPSLVQLNPVPLLFPTYSSDSMPLFHRRKKTGRYTVGLVNRANDCFANSNLQALAALPGLYAYLTTVAEMSATIESDPPPARLTTALNNMVRSLNEPILDPKCLSPWSLLRVLEEIYKSRISRAQHDAHELLHLVLETLENERKTVVSKLPEDAAKNVPPFPFSGSTVDRITCSKCGYSPPAPASAFLVLSLMVPQKRSVRLAELVDQLGAPEFIQDYGCTSCRLRAALRDPRIDSKLLKRFQRYEYDVASLPLDLEDQLPKNVTSPISKSTKFESLPKVFSVHLSRSIYGGYGASRNSCKVAVPEHLELYAAPNPTGTGTVLTHLKNTEKAPDPGNGLDPTPNGLNGSPPAALPQTLLNKKVRYRLAALIRHRGTHQTGHYECFRRKDLATWDAALSNPQLHAALDLGFRLSNRMLYPIDGAVSAPVPGSPISQASEFGGDVPGLGSAVGLPGPSTPRSEYTSSRQPQNGRALGDVGLNSADLSRSGSQRSGSSRSPAIDSLPFPTRPLPAHLSPATDPVHGTTSKPSSLSAATASSANGSRAGSPDVAPASPNYPWWKISDERVWECSTREVLKDEAGVYLLFYELEDDDSTTTNGQGWESDVKMNL